MKRLPVFLCVALMLAACGPRPLPVGGAWMTPDDPAAGDAPAGPAIEPATAESVPSRTPEPTSTTNPEPSSANTAVLPILYRPGSIQGGLYLVGGVQAGEWLSVDETAPHVQAGDSYALYANNLPLTTTGGAPNYEQICRTSFIPVQPHLGEFDLVGLPAAHPLTPGQAQDLPTDEAVYLQTVAEWLVDRQPSQPIVNISRVWRVDLESDGVDEVLISAARFAEPGGHHVEERDYSVVLMRKVSGNSVITVPLVGDFYGQPQQNAFPVTYSLVMTGDINDDGVPEVVVGMDRWEGFGVIVFEVDGLVVAPVLEFRCQL